MRRVGFAIAAFVALMGTSALAQSVTSVTGSGSSTFNGGAPVAGAGTASLPNTKRTAFNAFADTSGPLISFESSNVVGGAPATTTSTSSVNIGIKDNTGGFQFQSTITAAGLGMYVTDAHVNCVLTGTCVQATGLTFGDLVPGQVGLPPIGNATGIIGYTYIDFTVQGFDGTNLTTLFNLDGLLQLKQNTGTVSAQILPLVSSTSNLNQSLNSLDDLKNFQVVENTPNSYGISWEDTAFNFHVGAGIQNLIYTSRVKSFSGGDCDAFVNCLVTYGAFGDPIGRGGVSAFSAFSAQSSSTGGITDISGTPASFNRPTFVNGALVFQSGPIPEPATWISLIAGFGLLGAAMRRRRVLARA
jgi:hypothetical protein